MTFNLYHKYLHGLLCACIFLLNCSQQVWAQEFPLHETHFGKNRLQFKGIDWKNRPSDNFDMYYLEENLPVVEELTGWSESELKRITDVLGYAPYTKIQVFLYSTPQDMLQSNIGINTQNFMLSGRSNFNESLIEVAYGGSMPKLKQAISQEIANVVLMEMMYGRNIKEILRSSYLLNLPDWFISGAAAYVAEGWSSEMDNFARANYTEKRFMRPDSYRDNNAKLIGICIWNYVVQKHGIMNFSNILNLTRIVRNERSAFQGTLKYTFEVIMDDCRLFYTDKVAAFQKGLMRPNGIPVVSKIQADETINQISLSPAGEQLAYVRSTQGVAEIFIKKMPNGYKKRVFKCGYRIFNQKTIPNPILFAWANEQELWAISLEKGCYQLQNIKLNARKRLKPISFNFFEVINDMTLSSDGQTLILSASKNSQNDLYSYSFRTQQIKQLTDDVYDDFSPIFDGNSLVFSSNRPVKSIAELSKKLGGEAKFNFQNLFRLEGTSIQELSNSMTQNIKPVWIADKRLAFLSDQRGISQIYSLKSDKKLIEPLTNFLQDVEFFDYKNGHLTILTANRAEKTIFYFKNYQFSVSNMAEKTERQVIIDQYNMAYIRLLQDKVVLKEKDKPRIDSTRAPAEEIYQFDTFDNKNKSKRSHSKKNNKTYQNGLHLDQTTFSFVSDPLRGFRLFVESSLTDSRENHKIEAGVLSIGLNTLQNGVLYAQYQYLAKRTDFRLRLDRQALIREAPLFIQKYAMNKLSATASYPFSTTSRLAATIFATQTRFVPTSNLSQFTQAFASKQVTYSGLNFEFVLDNAQEIGPNMRKGTQVKATLDNYFALNAQKKSFTNLHLDARHYVQLTRDLILVGRLAMGTFFGAGGRTKSYRIGGVNNWLLGEENPQSQGTDPLFLNTNDPEAYKIDQSDILFVRYAMPLRGFEWNKLNGNSFLQANMEVRVCMLPEFYRRTIKSRFLKNLQVAGFVDTGSAWTGASPFNRENALNTVEIGGKPFYAKVSNFKDPFLVGYGWGFRSKILNMFTKFDIAWGLEDDVVLRPRYHLSVGYDF